MAKSVTMKSQSSISYARSSFSEKSIAPTGHAKRKSRFRKAPQAPKRFKSAYIFYSTEMMKTLKRKQNSSGKQKITDISKEISLSWKSLSQEERSKWYNIAKKDKERFIADKRNYKGPWQLPIKHEKGEQSQLLSSNSTLEPEALKHEHSSASTYMKQGEPISQEERDAAHNLVHLHQQRMVASFKLPNTCNEYTGHSSLPVKNGIPTNEFRGLIHTENKFDTQSYPRVRHCLFTGHILETGYSYSDTGSIFSEQEQKYCNVEDDNRKREEY